MGDRCYLEITLRRSDLDRFGKHLDAAPGAGQEPGAQAVPGPSDGNGIYQIPINLDQASGRWWIEVLENGNPVSTAIGVDMGGGCQNGIQEVKSDWRKRP